MTYIDRDDLLYSVQTPGQYRGGEFGSITYGEDQDLVMAVSFPDLYSIGMSNQAIKIIYNLANSVPHVQCERVFAPMEDMESLLRKRDIPHFTLEKGIPLNELDILAFSIGYELCFTNLLNILELGKIPLRRGERGEGDPIILAGGPSVTNPLPFSDFIDFFYIGEGEEAYVELLSHLATMKKEGRNRQELCSYLEQQDYLWFDGKKGKTRIIKYTRFGQEKGWTSALPVPTVETVQDHGVVEIMRGCPNKCRFCHAGVYYRPKREKDWDLIIEETDFLVFQAGYRDITLSSLSSGDFTDISALVDLLNERYRGLHVSFSLPSLRVNSLSLDLIEKIGEVKKSGLTFAVEAANEEWQHGINKDVSEEKIIEILGEAKRRGWRQAKFYFMLGLPVSIDDREEEEMISYLNRIQEATGMNLTVNIGTFIPKVFTPYQNARQLEEATSLEKILHIKRSVNKRIRVSFHSPFASLVEAIVSRGDKRAGELFLEAYRRGARLDSWDDHLDRHLWKELIANADWDVVGFTCSSHEDFTDLYDFIDLSVTEKSLKKENELSYESKLTIPCEETCHENCGICNRAVRVRNARKSLQNQTGKAESEEGGYYPYLLVMEKKEAARFIGHLDFFRAVERAVYRTGAPLKMTEGFNPKPKIEFASPLSLGADSSDEIVLMEMTGEIDGNSFREKFNASVCAGVSIREISALPVIEGKRKYTLMKNWGGSDWKVAHTGKTTDQLRGELSMLIGDPEIGKSFQLLDSPHGAVMVRHLFSREKVLYNSINKFLRERFEDYENFRLERVKSWAIDKDGELISYGELFS